MDASQDSKQSNADQHQSVEFTDNNIVRKDSRSAKYCPDAEDGAICKMSQPDAIQYCKEQGGHLPSTREFAEFINADAIRPADYVDSVPPPKGYYKVACEDESGNVDVFCFNNEGGRTLTGEIAKESFWTSSLVLGKPEYGHVFYGPLGGGGGPVNEHARTFRHAVILVGENQQSSSDSTTPADKNCWDPRTWKK